MVCSCCMGACCTNAGAVWGTPVNTVIADQCTSSPTPACAPLTHFYKHISKTDTRMIDIVFNETVTCKLDVCTVKDALIMRD